MSVSALAAPQNAQDLKGSLPQPNIPKLLPHIGMQMYMQLLHIISPNPAITLRKHLIMYAGYLEIGKDKQAILALPVAADISR